MGRVFANWKGETTTERFRKGISFQVNSLTIKDKGIYDVIRIYALVYDNGKEDRKLVSYAISSMGIDPEPRSLSIVLIIASLIVMVIYSLAFWRSLSEKRALIEAEATLESLRKSDHH